MANATTKVQSSLTQWGDDKIIRNYSTAATTYWPGCMIAYNSSGQSVHCDDTAGISFDGINVEVVPTVVPSGSTAGDYTSSVSRPWRFQMAIAAAVAGDEGKALYAAFDNLVAYSTSNSILVGFVDQVLSATAVSIIPLYSPLNPVAVSGNTLAFSGTTGANSITFPDNEASALFLAQGSNKYLQFVSTDGSEQTQVLGVAATGATNAGGLVLVTGGIGGASSGTGGAVTIAGGAGTTNAIGGAFSGTGGAGNGTGAGGASSLVGGAGGATAAGGVVTITGGAGGSSSGSGAAVTIAGGAGSAGNSVGGAVTSIGGAGSGSQAGGLGKVGGGAGGLTGAGGAAQVIGGAGGATSGTGGAVTITAGAGTGTSAVGGAVNILSGASAGGSGTAGNVAIDCGAANAGTPGSITIGGSNATSITLGVATTISGNLTLSTKNIVTDGATGTKIGTATTQLLGFYNATPIAQPAANTDTTTGAAGSSTAVYLNTTFTGASGTAAFTLGGVITKLKALGLLAA